MEGGETMITTTEPRLRIRGHGSRLRLRAIGRNGGDPLALVRECCRARVEKALGEAISTARRAGREWGEIAEALGGQHSATTRPEVIEARVEQQRAVWQRFWPGNP